MSDLALTNVINISVSAAPAGIGAYNTSNLGLFTREIAGANFGSAGYKIYKSASEVVKDFGSTSMTGKMALNIFSQKPNLLAGGGYLTVIPMNSSGGTQQAVVAQQLISFSAVADDGTYILGYNGNNTGAIAYNDNAAAVQVALRLLAGLATVTVAGDMTAGFVVTFTGVSGPALLLTSSSNSLDVGAADTAITISIVHKRIGVVANCESLDAAITRTKGLVQYFGILSAEITTDTEALAAAAVVQSLNKVAFMPSKLSTAVDPGGIIDEFRTGSDTQTRGLLYVHNSLDSDAILYAAAYASRALSTDFSGSNTTQTMHMKDLANVQPDVSMTETLLAAAQIAGADVYCSIQGVPKVFTSGANDFFDNVYNAQWFVGALQVAGFNALAQSSTKLPQTEQGVGVLKAAYRAVCEQAVSNQYCAPGTWTGSDTFGNNQDFTRNVQERGYYIYSSPVATQLAVDRAARKAPLIQIALKEAGAVHSSSVIVNINP